MIAGVVVILGLYLPMQLRFHYPMPRNTKKQTVIMNTNTWRTRNLRNFRQFSLTISNACIHMFACPCPARRVALSSNRFNVTPLRLILLVLLRPALRTLDDGEPGGEPCSDLCDSSRGSARTDSARVSYLDQNGAICRAVGTRTYRDFFNFFGFHAKALL